MVGDVTPLYPQYFLIGFRRFTKRTFVRSGETVPPSLPRGATHELVVSLGKKLRFRYSFTCQGTSTRRQRRELFGLRVKLPPVTTCLTTRRWRQFR